MLLITCARAPGAGFERGHRGQGPDGQLRVASTSSPRQHGEETERLGQGAGTRQPQIPQQVYQAGTWMFPPCSPCSWHSHREPAWPYPPILPGPLVMAQLEGADHQESSLPGSVQPLLASVSLPNFDLLYKQGIYPARAKGWHIPSPPPPHSAMSPTVVQGPVNAAGTGSDCSGRDMPRCPALALLQPLV